MLLVAGCSAASARRPAATQRPLARWTGVEHLRGVVDLTAPRAGRTIVVAARGRLLTLSPGGATGRFAPRYTAPVGLEPYIVLAGSPLRGARCPFPAGSVYALRLRDGNGVTAVSPAGAVRRFARLPGTGLEDGIALDATGRFGGRLLVSRTYKRRTTVYAIDCRGQVEVLTRSAPPVEGGMAVAPTGFGRFAGELIAPDEHTGNLYAISRMGGVTLVARSGLPHGQDIGVESLGFVPPRFTDAFVADRGTPGNPHPGDDEVLAIKRSSLRAAGVRSGDLLAVTEGGALTIAVSCAQRCEVREVATGPREAHVEGHVVFRGR